MKTIQNDVCTPPAILVVTQMLRSLPVGSLLNTEYVLQALAAILRPS